MPTTRLLRIKGKSPPLINSSWLRKVDNFFVNTTFLRACAEKFSGITSVEKLVSQWIESFSSNRPSQACVIPSCCMQKFTHLLLRINRSSENTKKGASSASKNLTEESLEP